MMSVPKRYPKMQKSSFYVIILLFTAVYGCKEKAINDSNNSKPIPIYDIEGNAEQDSNRTPTELHKLILSNLITPYEELNDSSKFKNNAMRLNRFRMNDEALIPRAIFEHYCGEPHGELIVNKELGKFETVYFYYRTETESL